MAPCFITPMCVTAIRSSCGPSVAHLRPDPASGNTIKRCARAIHCNDGGGTAGAFTVVVLGGFSCTDYTTRRSLLPRELPMVP